MCFHSNEGSLAYIKLAIADLITPDNALITCFSGQLIPATISHTLRVCLIAPIKYRIATAAEQQGISEKDLDHIFDPFFTRKKTMGVGVGLSICHGIIEDHRGIIVAENLPDDGAVFTIRLPLTHQPSA